MKPKSLTLLIFFALALLTGARAFAADSKTVELGSEITFKVTLQSGTPPFSYQWKRNGSDVKGANAETYVIKSAASADAGVYTCQVTNPAGSVRSDDGALQVNVVNPPSKGIVSMTVKIPEPPAPTELARP